MSPFTEGETTAPNRSVSFRVLQKCRYGGWHRFSPKVISRNTTSRNEENLLIRVRIWSHSYIVPLGFHAPSWLANRFTSASRWTFYIFLLARVSSLAQKTSNIYAKHRVLLSLENYPPKYNIIDHRVNCL